jgi:hypothetical protein
MTIRETVLRCVQQFGKSPGFLAFGFACLLALSFASYRNREPVASAVGVVAIAVFGGGAWKNHSDQAAAVKNGNGNGAPKVTGS